MNKFLVFLADGFEEIEALTPVDYLRRVGIEVDTVSISDKREVLGSHNILVLADKLISDINIDDYLGLYIPGGIPGATNLRDDERIIEIVKYFNEKGRIISSICAGPVVLGRADVIFDKKITSYPGFENSIENLFKYEKDEVVVVDKNIITAKGAAIAIYETFKIIEKIKGKEVVEQLKESIQQKKLEEFFAFKS